MARPPIDRGEWDAVLELCRRKTETEYDCEYFYRYELDSEGRLKNLFWADTDSMMGYSDVVVFDTTCRTNKHGVLFVPFVGLSNYRSPIVLGCGVTSDQSLDSLVWLLRAFKQSNDRRNGPASVITDDSDTVAGAVKAVFPGPTTASARGTWSRASRSTSVAHRRWHRTSSGP
ncbi:protein FAR1-RELATED SEQUENCE 7-like [Miscanthus floridulus]|uniref:protein FAR1-RELATED SEQUENCE 7-like n=1 Tax=Miscanthus floridulus TaxID=154761 RepID=UPI00345A412D